MDDLNKNMCKQCNKSFSSKSNLKHHISVKHSTSKLYVCGECFKEFPVRYYLTRHLRSHYPKLKCKDCIKTFSSTAGLMRHAKKGHCELMDSFQCAHCSRVFSRKSNLVRHIKTHSSGKKLRCPICGYSGIKSDLLEHFKVVHDIVLSRDSLQFNDFDDFLSWKTELEKAEKCFFGKKVSYLSKKSGSGRHIYQCHRSGEYKSRGRRERSLKKMGSNKINGLCPSQLDVCTSDSGVVVNYIKTHVGHSPEVGRQSLTKSERNSIAQKLAQNISFKSILDEIRDTTDENNLSRVHLLTKKDLYNIQKSFGLSKVGRRYENAFNSVESWIAEMQNSTNIIRFYKPRGQNLPDFSEVERDDFILILANDSQLDLLQKFGNEFICLDVIHGPNTFECNLTTLLVLDDLRQGFPCAFLFSNRNDEKVIELFLKLIKQLVNKCIRPTVFMSGMDPSFFNTWKKVMFEPTLRLFCSWDVDRAWRENLNKINDQEKQALAYQLLRKLLEETNEKNFLRLFETSVKHLKSDPVTLNFAQYFEENYKNNSKSWAYCFRKHAGLNTNVHLERLHKTLKYIYFQGRKASRLDKTLHAIMKFVRDKLYDRLIATNKEQNTTKLSLIRKRHHLSNTVDISSFTKEQDTWILPSSNSKIIYEIKEANLSCSCCLKCSFCEFCVHSYTCSCPDNAIKWNMCKHIHALGRYLSQSNSRPQSTPSSPDEVVHTDMFIDGDDGEQSSSRIEYLTIHNPVPHENLDEMKSKLIEQFMNTLNKADDLNHLTIMSNYLLSASAAIDASKEEGTSLLNAQVKVIENRSAKLNLKGNILFLDD